MKNQGNQCFILNSNLEVVQGLKGYKMENSHHVSWWDGQGAMVFDSEKKAREWAKENDVSIRELIPAAWLGVKDAKKYFKEDVAFGDMTYNTYVATSPEGVLRRWEGHGFGGYSGGMERKFRSDGFGDLVLFRTREDAEKIGEPKKLVKYLASIQ